VGTPAGVFGWPQRGAEEFGVRGARLPATVGRSAERSRTVAFPNLARRIENHVDAVVADVELDLVNSRREGVNAKIQLSQRRGYGFRNLDALTAD
jgi:transposase